MKWTQEREAARVRFHSWWDSPAVLAIAERIHPQAAHASWFENFPWNRLPGVELPAHDKPPVTDPEAMRELDPTAVRAAIGDGSTAVRTPPPTRTRSESGRPEWRTSGR